MQEVFRAGVGGGFGEVGEGDHGHTHSWARFYGCGVGAEHCCCYLFCQWGCRGGRSHCVIDGVFGFFGEWEHCVFVYQMRSVKSKFISSKGDWAVVPCVVPVADIIETCVF
jgi:hypothetical protein